MQLILGVGQGELVLDLLLPLQPGLLRIRIHYSRVLLQQPRRRLARHHGCGVTCTFQEFRIRVKISGYLRFHLPNIRLEKLFKIKKKVLTHKIVTIYGKDIYYNSVLHEERIYCIPIYYLTLKGRR